MYQSPQHVVLESMVVCGMVEWRMHESTNVQGTSMDDGLGVRGKKFMALACTIVPRVWTTMQGANKDDGPGVRGKNFIAWACTMVPGVGDKGAMCDYGQGSLK